MSDGGKGADQNITNVPWTGQQPHLQNLFGAAGNLFQQQGQQYYPGAGYVPFSPQTQQAFDLTTQRSFGSPYEQAAGQYSTLASQAGGQGASTLFNMARDPYGAALGGGLGAGESPGFNPGAATASGAFLNANPFLNEMFGQAAGNLSEQFSQGVMPSIAATFGGAGRTGGGLFGATVGTAAGQLADAQAQLASDIYGQNYARERGLQMGTYEQAMQRALQAGSTLGQQALGAGALAPGLQAMDYQNIDRLMGVGGRVEDQARQILGDDLARWQFQQQWPYTALDQYSNIIQGLPAGYGTQTTSGGQGSPLLGALGGAASGASAGAAFGPWGVGIGAGAGLLGGLFG